MFGKTKKNHGSRQGNYGFYCFISIFLICFVVNICHAEKCEYDLDKSITEACDLYEKLAHSLNSKYIGVYQSYYELVKALEANGYTKFLNTGGVCSPEWEYQIFGHPPYLYDNVAYGFSSRYDAYACPPPPDSDGDGISDKEDLDFLKTTDKGLGVDTDYRNTPCDQTR